MARSWARPEWPEPDLGFSVTYGRFVTNIHSYYRATIPGLKLREHGFCETYLPDEVEDSSRFQLADVIVLNRPNMKEELESIDFLRSQGKTVIVDTDDYAHLCYTLTKELAKVWDDEHLENFEACVRLADMVTVSVPPLADRMEELGARRVAVLDNALDPRSGRWDVEWPEDDGKIRIGWSAGWTHGADADVIAGAVKRVLAKYPQAVFKTMGYMPMWIAELEPDQIEVAATGGVLSYPKLLVGTDIGLGALAPIEFNEYRSSVKWQEYTCAGSVFVGSNLGPYKRDIRHGVDGLLCDTEDDWVDALSELIEDPERRSQMWREAARACMKKSIDWRIGNFYLAYRTAVGDRLRPLVKMRPSGLYLP